jgi:predicted transcriptional regulator
MTHDYICTMEDHRMAEGVFTVRIAPEKQRQLDALAPVLDRPRTWVVSDAIDQYLDIQAWQMAHIQHGVEEADRGDLVPHDEVSAETRAKLRRARGGQ